MIKLVLPILMLLSSIAVFAKGGDTLYFPEVEGTIRAKYEYSTNTDEHRFQVRNARFSLNGKFSAITSYKAEIDLSDEGVTKMLDAYIKIQPKKWWSLTIGQQKVPFSTDNLRSPHQLYFANRSFIGKQLTGLRDVGATFMLINKKIIPIDILLGTYNGTGLYNQKQWRTTDELSFAGRAVIKPSKIFNISLNFNSIKPTYQRMNLFNAGFFVDIKNLHLESEYFFKTYQDTSLTPTQGFFAFVSYDIKTSKLKNIKKISPVFRYDMMTKNLKFDDSGVMKTDIERWRLTGGLTFTLDKPFLNDIRLNYEHYFYDQSVVNSDNKLVLEFVVRF